MATVITGKEGATGGLGGVFTSPVRASSPNILVVGSPFPQAVRVHARIVQKTT
jgi:hypothetical protein